MAAQLCDRCRVLQIDDSVVGVVRSILGGKVEYLEYRLPGTDKPPANIPLDYIVEDTLPGLPALKASVDTPNSRCSFCRLLRECILNSRPEDETWEARIKSWLRLAYPNPIREALDEATIKMFQETASRSQKLYPNIKKPGSFWPSRLIEIESTLSGTALRLVLRDDIQNSGDSCYSGGYAALSYCWGTAVHAAKQAKTRTDTLEQRRAGISESDLTPVIRDTVKVCQSLGIRYLWVDALCILQDSLQDWEMESMAMADIYSGASITICPLHTSHCEQSFLSRHLDWEIQIPFASKLRPRIKGEYTLRYSGTEETDEINEVPTPPDSLERALKSSPWMKRGWTYQEMQLSRQILCFGKCRTWLIGTRNATNEKGDFEVPTPTILPTLSEELFSNGLSDELKVTHLWMALIQNYSSRQFTYQKDVFPALSGLAKILSRGFQNDYVAGIWKKNLLRQLFWRIPQNEILRQPLLSFRSLEGLLKHLSDPGNCFGPSWSWASRCLGVEYNSETDASFISRDEVEEANAQTRVGSLNPFGAVLMGAVYLRTKARHLDFSKGRQYSDSGMKAVCEWVVQVGGNEVHCGLDWLCEELPASLSTNARIVLLQSARYWLNDDTDLDNQALGLVLYPVDKVQNTWVRIGTFTCGGRPGVSGMRLFEDEPVAEVTII